MKHKAACISLTVPDRAILAKLSSRRVFNQSSISNFPNIFSWFSIGTAVSAVWFHHYWRSLWQISFKFGRSMQQPSGFIFSLQASRSQNVAIKHYKQSTMVCHFFVKKNYIELNLQEEVFFHRHFLHIKQPRSKLYACNVML